MALEGTYEYECMRAELLGVDKPDYGEFMKNKAEREAAAQEAFKAEEIRAAHAQQEGFQHVSGKLDELNNILKSTQNKINNFAAPFSKFLRSKIGKPSSTTPKEDESLKPDPAELESDPEEYKEPVEKTFGVEYPLSVENKDNDLNPSYMPVIDDIIDKYERAETSMKYQNKQMKRFLN